MGAKVRIFRGTHKKLLSASFEVAESKQGIEKSRWNFCDQQLKIDILKGKPG